MPKWNLSEDLQAGGRDNYFEPPLAAAVASTTPFQLPPDVPPQNQNVYTFAEQYTDITALTLTADVGLTVKISPPPGGYPTHPSLGSLPTGAFRLHAVTRGRLRFDPASSALKLEMKKAFESVGVDTVPWWQNWLETKRYPAVFIYENVDQSALNTILTSIPADQPGQYGITFPTQEDGTPIADRAAFINEFFLGQRFFDVVAGAVIGAAGPRAGSTNPDEHEVVFRVRYDNDTAMSPREFFYLAFGDKSPHATKHPLFIDIASGVAFVRTLTTSPVPVTKWGMRMRPPLRTMTRVMWEGAREQEVDDGLKAGNGLPHWGSTGCSLDAGDTLFDRLFAQYDAVKGYPKCNIFVGDLSVRAGFRTPVVANPPNARFPKAGWMANYAVLALSQEANETRHEVPLKGTGGTQWGSVLTRILTSVDINDAAKKKDAIAAINKKSGTQGRLLILAMCRPRARNKKATTCVAGSFQAPSGHIIFVEELETYTHLANRPPTAPGKVDLTDDVPTIPAPKAGETRRKETTVLSIFKSRKAAQASSGHVGAQAAKVDERQLGGLAGESGDATGFIRIQLMEARPGGDPDLLHGLKDLHVPTRNLDFLGTKLERCRKKFKFDTPQGQRCCEDKWPTATPDTVTCT
jgi:hypothetical protein